MNDEQLNKVYNFCDVTVLPSMGEGFGLPIIESLAAGVPVIATDHSACRELVSQHGELVRVAAMLTMGTNVMEYAVIDVEDLARCIKKLYLNPELVRSYGRAGRIFAETLSWDNLMPKWLEVISLASGVEGV